MDLRRFHEEDKRIAYTRTKRHAHVLLLLMILRNNMYDLDGHDDDGDDGGEVDEMGSSSCCWSVLSAIERTQLSYMGFALI